MRREETNHDVFHYNFEMYYVDGKSSFNYTYILYIIILVLTFFNSMLEGIWEITEAEFGIIYLFSDTI